MGSGWFEYAKMTAYYLWEHTGCEDALDLWYAAEDIASFFEQANILDAKMVEGIVKLGPGSEGYIWFVRNIAFRLHVYAKNSDDLANWYLVEKLLNTPAWVQSIVAMAFMLSADDIEAISQVRSDPVRSFYR